LLDGERSPNFDLVYDRKKPTSVIDSVGDPKMFFRRVADVNVAMSKRYGMLIEMGVFANEFDRVAGSDLLVDIATTINSIRRFAFEVCYPRWIMIARCFLRAGLARRPAAAAVATPVTQTVTAEKTHGPSVA
jgi:hypothetical protein